MGLKCAVISCPKQRYPAIKMLVNLPSVFKTFETLILSWTSYAPLAKATDPGEFDFVLRKTIRDIKFHCETLLSMLFFMGATMRNSPLISWTLASLLYSLISYTALEAMSGESLHLHLDAIPAGRPLLACLAKFPALTVLATLCALAVTSWNSVFTAVVLVACAGILALVLVLRLRVHAYVVAALSAASGAVVQFAVACLLGCVRVACVGVVRREGCGRSTNSPGAPESVTPDTPGEVGGDYEWV